MEIEFEWDEGNIQHVIHDYPERENKIAAVESLFYDPYFTAVFDRFDQNSGEPRYCGVGIGTEGIEKYVVFVVRNGKIRPISCRRAKRNQRTEYHETVSQKRSVSSGGDETGLTGEGTGNDSGSQELVIPSGS